MPSPDLADTTKERGPSPHTAAEAGGSMDKMAAAAAAGAAALLATDKRSVLVRTREKGSCLCSMPLANTASLRCRSKRALIVRMCRNEEMARLWGRGGGRHLSAGFCVNEEESVCEGGAGAGGRGDSDEICGG